MTLPSVCDIGPEDKKVHCVVVSLSVSNRPRAVFLHPLPHHSHCCSSEYLGRWLHFAVRRRQGVGVLLVCCAQLEQSTEPISSDQVPKVPREWVQNLLWRGTVKDGAHSPLFRSQDLQFVWKLFKEKAAQRARANKIDWARRVWEKSEKDKKRRKFKRSSLSSASETSSSCSESSSSKRGRRKEQKQRTGEGEEEEQDNEEAKW